MFWYSVERWPSLLWSNRFILLRHIFRYANCDTFGAFFRHFTVLRFTLIKVTMMNILLTYTLMGVPRFWSGGDQIF